MNAITKKIIISGGDSWVNRGDKAILTGSLKILEKIPNTEILILSGASSTTKQDFPNHRIVNRYNIIELMTSVKDSDLFLWGGGHLLQNTSSKFFLAYQFCLLMVPILLKKKIMGFAIGVEKINGRFWRQLAKLILNKFSFISVRDELSKKILIELGTETPIYVTTDPAVILEPNDAKDNNSNIKIDAKFAIIAPRRWFYYKSKILPVKWQNEFGNGIDEGFISYISIFSRIADYLVEKYSVNIYFLPMYPGNEQGDEIISKKIISLMKNKKSAKIFDSNIDSTQLIDFIRNSCFLLGMRMHSTILSICANTPAIAVYYQNKGRSFFESMGLENYAIPIENLEEEIIFSKIDQLFNNQNIIKKEIQDNLEILRQKALVNLSLIQTLLNN